MFIYLLIHIIYNQLFIRKVFVFLSNLKKKIKAQNPSNQINNKDYKISTQYLLMLHKST